LKKPDYPLKIMAHVSCFFSIWNSFFSRLC
jgi:hypothetical protein